MALELSPIIPLLAGLNPAQRGNCLSVGALVRRQQKIGQWGGSQVVFTMNRNQILEMPVLVIDAKSVRSMGIVKIITSHYPEACAMLYEDQHGAAWCVRLNGPGIPVIQDDLFQSYTEMAVWV